MVWDEPPIQRVIWVQGKIDRPIYHTLVLALCRRRHIRAVLLQLQLDLDAHVFEEALHELHGIHQVTPQARSRRELRLKALGIPGFHQQAPGFLGIMLIIPGTRPELIDGQRPPTRPRASAGVGSP